jgi:ABC-type transporter Mla MlaB component
MPSEAFDVFLCHNSKDKDFIVEIYDRLSDRGIKPWIDDDLTPGGRSSADLAQQIRQVRSVAVFVGRHGIGRWQQQEIDLAIGENTKRGMPVIPVWLADAPEDSELSHFLENFTWVDFRETRLDPFERLVKGIPLEPQTAIAKPNQSGLKPGAPDPRVRLPDNFVDRPDAINAVKSLLLTEEKTVVVSAIAGLGGLGKSVLAAALVLDEEVRSRFCDGILWVTLGQNPDLLGLVGDWIWALDKSRESYGATTLESASRYLHTLLLEKRVLLVVDDAWNAAHVDYFRVGGAGCRVLVTTRTTVIAGAERYDLALMSPEESLELVRNELGDRWQMGMEPSVREFARLLGYLPLALTLMAVQVRRGRKWEMLRKAFLQETERLRSLDYPGVKLAAMSDEKRREYSLRSCFQLSLQWLEPELLQQFVWLGVLPEDATIQQAMAMTLWDVEDWQAEEILLQLSENSLLSRGAETRMGEVTYRVHDLLHDMAQELIERSSLAETLPGLGLTVAAAHVQFLERYRSQGCWHRLVNDGYIYRHLTWHFVQAGWEDALHDLLAMSDEQGRNAWFEACDRIGEPGVFVQDVKRGWAIAEGLYERDAVRAIVLQCRYALMVGTLNSLVKNLSGKLMAAFVKGGFWTIEQTWAYVEQMQDESKVIQAIRFLAPYLTKTLFKVVLEKGRSIQNENSRASVLSAFARIDSAYFSEALEAARLIQNENSRASVLSDLTRIGSADFSALLEAARSIQNEYSRAFVLRALAQIDSAYFPEALEAARSIQNEYSRASVLSDLAQIDSAYFPEALEAARSIQNEDSRAKMLSDLAQIDSAYFPEALEAARLLQDGDSRAYVLSALAQIDSAYFPEALEAARSIQDEYRRAPVLSDLARIDSAYFSEALEAARSLQDEDWRASALSTLAQIDSAYFSEALEAARSLQSESRRASALSTLAQIDSADFSALLEAARSLQDESRRASVLSALAQIDRADFSALLEAARSLQSESRRASVLSALAQIDSAYFSEALEAARSLQDEDLRASALRALAQIDSAYFSEALEAARSLQSESRRASTLSTLAQIDSAYFSEALEAARSLQSESRRASALSTLAQIDSAYFSALLEAARSLQDESRRASVLSAFAQIDRADFSALLEAARSIQNESKRTSVLKDLAKNAPDTFLSEIYQAISEINNKPTCAQALSGTLPRLPLATLPHPDWCKYLHLLAHRDRASLMGDLATLHPAILHLGGEAAVRGMVDAMRDVCSQWK